MTSGTGNDVPSSGRIVLYESTAAIKVEQCIVPLVRRVRRRPDILLRNCCLSARLGQMQAANTETR